MPHTIYITNCLYHIPYVTHIMHAIYTTYITVPHTCSLHHMCHLTHIPYVGLVAVVFPRQVACRAPVRDPDHGDFFPVAGQVARGGAETWALGASAQGVCNPEVQLLWGHTQSSPQWGILQRQLLLPWAFPDSPELSAGYQLAPPTVYPSPPNP